MTLFAKSVSTWLVAEVTLGLHCLQIIHAWSQAQLLIVQSVSLRGKQLHIRAVFFFKKVKSEKSKPLDSPNSNNQKEESHNRCNQPLRFLEGM